MKEQQRVDAITALMDKRIEILYKQQTVAHFSPEAIARLFLNGEVNRTQLKTVA
jgi:hypothetical protein